METPKNFSIKVQRIIGMLCRMSFQSANIIFSRMSVIFFSDAGNVIFKCIFWEKDIFYFFNGGVTQCLQEEEIPYFPNMQKTSKQKQGPSFLMIQERSYSSMVFFGKAIFSEHLKKILYFHVFDIQKTSCFQVFFEKDHLSFFAHRIRSHFLEEEISSFLMIQETSYSRAIYLERLFFQNIWKKDMVFRAVQIL